MLIRALLSPCWHRGPLLLLLSPGGWVLACAARLPAVDPERLEHAGVLGLPRRRLGDESDPDYEFEQQRPRQALRRPGSRGPAGSHPGVHPWDVGPDGTLPETSSILGSGSSQRFLSLLPGSRSMSLAVPVSPAARVAHLTGEPLVTRYVSRVPTFGSSAAEGELVLPAPVTVRIYMTSSASSGASAADTAAALELPPPQLEGRAQVESHMQLALDHMVRRVGRAQLAVTKGVPTTLPPLASKASADPASQRQPASVLASLTALQQRSSCGLHRLARPSAVNYSPFSRRPHNMDSDDQSSSSSGSSGEGLLWYATQACSRWLGATQRLLETKGRCLHRSLLLACR